MPGCIGVASELISYDEKYKGVIENLLGRTVISDNLDHGIAIMRAGHHAFRLVTLSGDLMHSGGSMTGGSIQSKMTNLLGREREIKDLEKKIQEGKATYASFQSQLASLQQNKDQVKAEITEITDSLHQQEIAVARENERLDNAASDLQQHQQRIQETHEAEEQLTLSIEQIDQQLFDIEHSGSQVEMDQEAIDKKNSRASE
jgi:chromosome segregation protein